LGRKRKPEAKNAKDLAKDLGDREGQIEANGENLLEGENKGEAIPSGE